MEQQRAAFALKKIKGLSLLLKDAKDLKELKSNAASLPAMIHMNGFGQAMAFALSHPTNAWKSLYTLLEEWLCKGDNRIFDKEQKLMDAITAGDMQRYMAAQAEAQALLVWIKKFTKAFLDENGNGDTK